MDTLAKFNGSISHFLMTAIHIERNAHHDLKVFIIVKTIRGGEKATDEVWEGAHGLEWTVPSPAPYHTFATAPEVK